RDGGLRRAAARQHTTAVTERGGSPFAAAFDVRRDALGEDVAGEMVAPHAQGHFEFDARLAVVGDEDGVIGGAIFEAAGADLPRMCPTVADPEAAGIEQMRAEVGDDATTLVAPLGIAD